MPLTFILYPLKKTLQCEICLTIHDMQLRLPKTRSLVMCTRNMRIEAVLPLMSNKDY